MLWEEESNFLRITLNKKERFTQASLTIAIELTSIE